MNTKELRKQLGVSQDRFAAMLLMTPMSVKRWESGKSKPSPLAMEALKKLAEENQNNEEDYSRSMF